MGSMELPTLNCAAFDAIWQELCSDPLPYDNIISVQKRSVTVVEFRNSVSSKRAGALDQAMHGGNAEYVREQCMGYIAAIRYVGKHADELSDKNGSIRAAATWFSALAPHGPFGGAIRINTHGSLVEEQSLMLQRWIAATWHLAQERMALIVTKAEGERELVLDQQAMQASLGLLKEAAGAAEALSGVLAPLVAEACPQGPPRKVPEYASWLGGVLRDALLGQAHHIVAHTALSRSTFPLAAKIFHAAAACFASATRRVAQAEGEDDCVPTKAFTSFVALHESLSLSRARCCQARQLLAEDDAAQASVVAALADSLLADFTGRGLEPGMSGSLEVAEAQRQEAQALLKRCEDERRFVYSQQPSTKPAPPLPEARTVVSPASFTLPDEDFSLDFIQV